MIGFSSGTRSDRVGIRTRDGRLGVFRPRIGGSRRKPGRGRAVCTAWESLEARELLTTPGYDYNLSGLQWPDPSHITASIAPDGVWWDHGINDLNATFTARFGNASWQRQFARALATWESVANLNISEVPDGPFDLNTFGLAQGDPRFGDIRLGGYPFPNDTTTLAQTYEPPPNGSTSAGDIETNTSIAFGIGRDFDLYSVLLHETGHSLGLEHAQNPADVMYAVYQGIRPGLGAGDIAGIQAIYGARTPDPYQSQGQGVSVATAVDLSGGRADSATTTVGNLSLAAIGDSEFFSVVAPSWGGTVLQVTATASTISLLSPKVELVDSHQQLLAEASQPSAWGDDVTVSFPAVVPGQRYTIIVTGATGDVFDVGGYDLAVGFPDGTPPVPPPPASAPPSPTPPPPVAPPSQAGPPGPGAANPTNDSRERATALGPIIPGDVTEVVINGSAAVAWFAFQAVQPGTYQVTASGAQLSLFNPRGKRIAARFGALDLRVSHGHPTVYLEVASSHGGPLAIGTMTLTMKKASSAAHPQLGARPARPSARFPRHHPRDVPALAEGRAVGKGGVLFELDHRSFPHQGGLPLS